MGFVQENRRTLGERGVDGIVVSLILIVMTLSMGADPARAQAGAGQGNSTGSDEAESRFRLTLSGLYTVDTYAQKNFFLGAEAPDSSGLTSSFDSYWTQRLTLRPRLILSDDLNLNLSVDLAHGVWGLDNQTPDPAKGGYTNLYDNKGTFLHPQVNWAYLAYRHAGTQTRWYLGRQKFGPGHLLVLDVDAPGLLVYRDFPGWNSSLSLGLVKESEGANALTDRNGINPADSLRNSGPDGRDADIYLAEWRTEARDRSRLFNPFFIYYLDRSNADRRTLLPNDLGYLDSRFHPNISRAMIAGAAARWQMGMIHLDAEVDYLKGKDRVLNADSGPDAVLDRNIGDLKGYNAYGRLSAVWPQLEIAGTVAMGSGDDDVLGGDGNFNSLRSQGNFYITEVWEDGLALDERGMNPDGLGNPYVRGYRGLENTRIFQGSIAAELSPSLKVSGSYSMIRASRDIRPWFDSNRDGVITREEYGRDVRSRNQLGFSTELGTEIDGRIDWKPDPMLTVTLRAGAFTPGVAAGYLINGTEIYQETAREIRLGVSVPISEFSIGG